MQDDVESPHHTAHARHRTLQCSDSLRQTQLYYHILRLAMSRPPTIATATATPFINPSHTHPPALPHCITDRRSTTVHTCEQYTILTPTTARHPSPPARPPPTGTHFSPANTKLKNTPVTTMATLPLSPTPRRKPGQNRCAPYTAAPAIVPPFAPAMTPATAAPRVAFTATSEFTPVGLNTRSIRGRARLKRRE